MRLPLKKWPFAVTDNAADGVSFFCFFLGYWYSADWFYCIFYPMRVAAMMIKMHHLCLIVTVEVAVYHTSNTVFIFGLWYT